MVRTFQLTKVLSKMTVIENMLVGATGQTRRGPVLGHVRAPVARPGGRQHRRGPTTCSSGSCSIKKREDFAGSLSGRPAQAARDGARPHGRPRAGHARRADGGREPGAQAVAARPREVAARRGPDRAVRRARHGHGPRHLRLGDRDGAGPDRRRGPARRGHERPGRDRRLPRRPTTTPTSARRWRRRSSPRPRPRSRPSARTGRAEPRTQPMAEATVARPRPPTVDRSAHLAAAEGAVLRADDLVAGYLPGRQHPQRVPTSTARRASWSASSAPTAPASRPCSRRCSAW